jgi:hypothetical protein
VSQFLNFRAQPVSGGVVDPYLLRGDGEISPAVSAVSWSDVNGLIDGKDVLFAVHGFNVNYADALRTYSILDQQLALGESAVLIGVLWPGDFWIPAVNYPFEGSDAMDCGRRLAAFCTRYLGGARSLSFMSHSLGARLVLEAVATLASASPPRRARLLRLTAGAINRDCLSTEYASSAKNADAIRILASHKDVVLAVAFQIGDPISNVLHDDHQFFEKALGSDGPAPEPVPNPVSPWQIPDSYDFGHGSYLPPDDASRWPLVADYVRRAFFDQPSAQPAPFPAPLP